NRPFLEKSFNKIAFQNPRPVGARARFGVLSSVISVMYTRSSQPPRRTLLKLLVLLISTGLALGAAELVLRVRNPLGFRMRGNTLKLPANQVYDIRADERSRSDQLDAHVVHTKNSLGFRGPEPPDDFKDWLTLVAVGGSTTECFYLSDGRTWPERLAVRLQPDLRKVWVDNAGLDGHSTFGHLLLTRQALVPLRPKVILYLVGL